MAEPVRRDWCEEHNRGSLAATAGLCPECQERDIRLLSDSTTETREELAELIAEHTSLKALMKRREQFILGLLWTAADKQEALEREIAGERDARHKLEAALTAKDRAMGVLFERLAAAGVDCSDLIP